MINERQFGREEELDFYSRLSICSKAFLPSDYDLKPQDRSETIYKSSKTLKLDIVLFPDKMITLL